MNTRDQDELLKHIKPGQTVRVIDVHKVAQSAGIANLKRKTISLLKGLEGRGEVKMSPDDLVITRPKSAAKATTKSQAQRTVTKRARSVPAKTATKPNPVALAFADAGQDIGKAAKLLFERLRHDTNFLEAHRDAMLKAWCHDSVRQYVASIRLKSWTAGKRAPANESVSTSRARRSAEASVLNFPLPGGKRLWDATGADVAQAARDYRRTEQDAMRKAAWLESIAARVALTKRVSEVLTATQLKKLKAAANA